MKDYETPNLEFFLIEEVNDVVTLSVGTSNDNDYNDRGDWFNT